MQIKNRLYPYPIIDRWRNSISPTEDYQTTIFDTSVNFEQDSNTILLKFTVSIKNNEQIVKLIEEDKLVYAFHVECPKTSFRKLYTFKENLFEVIFSSGELNGKVEISPFIVAKQDIENFTNLDLHSDYKGIEFFIEKASIVGIGRQEDLKITKEKDELADIPSIFSVCIIDSEIETDMSINTESNKISIFLPKLQFNKYRVVAKIDDYRKIVHSLIVFPALLYVLEELKQSGEDAEEKYSDKGWYRSIKKAMEKRGFNFQNIKTLDSYKWAQILIEYPLYDGLDQLLKDGEVGGIE